jgi:predicted transcriptional regulator
MNLAEIVERLDLKVFSGHRELARTVGGGYAGDLLSDVMAHAQKDHLWITIQVHPNIVAVAVLKDLSAILLANGREPAEETAARAEKENIPVLGTAFNTFEIAAKLGGLGVRGA